MLAHWTIRRALGAAALTLVVAGAAAAQDGKDAKTESDPVLAVVNGEEIRLSDAEALRQQLPQDYRQVPLERIYPALVDNLINTKLAAADARKRGIPEDAEFKQEMAFHRERTLERFVMRREIEEGIDEGEVRKRYEKLSQDTKGNSEINARHILVKDKAKAEEIIGKLEGGADFAELAKTESVGPSASDGGNLGYFSQGQMVPAFEEAAFKLEKGEITKQPVKTQFGWHVIKVEDRKAVAPPPFEEASGRIRGEMAQEIGRKYIESLRDDAKVQRYELDGTPQNTMTPADTPSATGGSGQN